MSWDSDALRKPSHVSYINVVCYYKTPYNSFKDYFNNYKKGKSLEPLTFPQFNKDLKLTVKAFQEEIPDLIGLLPPDNEPNL